MDFAVSLHVTLRIKKRLIRYTQLQVISQLDIKKQNKTTTQKPLLPQPLGVHWHNLKPSSVKSNVTAGGNGS